MFIDRYQAAGLRCNPFAFEALAPADAAQFVDRGLPAPPPPGSATLVQVIGDKGAGKTTHVMMWRRQAPGPYHYVPRDPRRDRWIAPPVAPLVYGDELDRMPWTVRRRWFRRLAQIGATVVAGTHRDLTAPAQRAGLRVVTHHLGPVDRATLDAVIDCRLRAVSLSSRPVPDVLRESDVADVHERSGGNLREAERLLHEVVAERVREDEPQRRVS